MARPIEQLKLKNFRGASGTTEVALDTKKSMIMVFGENGSGKSTIVDALDLVANKRVGSLAYRSMGRKTRYLPTIGKKPADLVVDLVSGERSWSAKVVGQTITVDTDDEMPRVRILRRAELLKLIEATPAERYDVLRGFIDVVGVENGEQALRESLRQTETQLNAAAQSLSDAEDTLEEWWTGEGSPGDSAEEWARAKSDGNATSLEEEVSELQDVTDRLTEVVRTASELSTANETLTGCETVLNDIQKEIDALPDVEGAQAVRLIELLQTAQGLIQEPAEPTTCPVCEQPIVAADLRSSISTRLESMKSHKRLAESRSVAKKDFSAALGARTTAARNYVKTIRLTANTLRSAKRPPKQVGAIPWQDFTDFLSGDAAGGDAVAKANELEQHLRPLQPVFSGRREMLQADLNQLNAIKSSYTRILSNRQRGKSLETLVARMRRAVTICEDARREFTQDILNSVADESERLYNLVHPDEQLGSPRLRMDPNRRNSIEQDASFGTHSKIPPQAYFSESHLDTLGFCVWLAIVKRERPRETVVVLDDIFTSVDGVHLTRIMSLLSDIADEFLQVIVTTHYRTWRDRYRLHQAAGFTVQLLELHPWSLNRGIAVSGTKLATEDLRDALASEPLNRQAVASQSGILLEAILDRLTIQYRRRLPRTPEGVWTLGDLLNGCSRLFKVLKIEKPSGAPGTEGGGETLEIAIQPFVDAFNPLVFIRSQLGCHFNLTGCEVANSDVDAFGKATVSLVEALMCPVCGDIPSRSGGSFFQCGCKASRMTPLEFNK